MLVFKRRAVDGEKACSKLHILLKDVNDFVPIISIFLHRFRQYSVLVICPHSTEEIMSFIGTGERKSASLAEGLGEFLLLIPSFSPNRKCEFDGIRSGASGNSDKTNCLQFLSTSIKLDTADVLFFMTAC